MNWFQLWQKSWWNFYPEVKEKTEFIQKVVKNEEERFHETLNEGLTILSSVIKKQKEAGKQCNSR